MNILFIGGTGLISSACAKLALERGVNLSLLTRGQSWKYVPPQGAQSVHLDVHRDEAAVAGWLDGRRFDAVVDWIAYTTEDIERDIRLFSGRTRQFLFISSASAYQKPLDHYIVTEETPLANSYWQYSRNKIACEARLMEEFRQAGFPVTIVRPSLTYGPSQIPLSVGSWMHPYTVIQRMKQGKKIIIQGDGTSLWVLTWNEDFAVGLQGLLGNESVLGEAFHITSDEALTWNQIYKEVGNALGVELDVMHLPSEFIAAYDPETIGSLIGDKSHSAVFDNGKIRRFVPEFKPAVTWAEGVRRCLAWFEADPARCTVDARAEQIWERMIQAYQRALPQNA
ncbi:MAG: NAD-dependent epimerase/dehydratase family protein [Chloroflexi bacterium]|nr:NAD-dependent epimerase/dehydratase family protein [Chloroflexota bacterium]